MTRTYPTTSMCDGGLLARFEPTTRDTDIFCVTAAKCGQTWLLAILHHLRTRGHDPDLGGGRGLHSFTPWLELPRNIGSDRPYDRDQRIAQMEALTDPRIFKMHVLYDEIPRPRQSPAKIITITRDARDVPYSMYRHLLSMQPDARPSSKADESWEAYFDSWMGFGYYFKVVRSFWSHRDDRRLLWLRYEDLKRDLHGEARKILEFTGWELSNEDIDRALSWVGFEHMRANERTHILPGGERVWRPDANFFREGAVGKNRAQLSPEQEQRLVARAREEFEPECFEWVMAQEGS